MIPRSPQAGDVVIPRDVAQPRGITADGRVRIMLAPTRHDLVTAMRRNGYHPADFTVIVGDQPERLYGYRDPILYLVRSRDLSTDIHTIIALLEAHGATVHDID